MAAEVLEGNCELNASACDELSEGVSMENPTRHPALLLLIVGEPFNVEQRAAIAEKLKQGLNEWDAAAAECSLVDQLNVLFTGELPATAQRQGGKCFQLHADQLIIEVIISPSTKLAAKVLKSFAAAETHYRFLLHAGLSFQPTGSWICSDGHLSYGTFRDQFLGNINGRGPIDLAVTTQGSWSSANLTKLAPDNRIRVKSTTSCEPGVQFDKFISAVVSHCETSTALDLLVPSDVVGSVTLSKPTLYTFPAGDGMSAVFGIRGFTLLVDGGYMRRSCFWDLIRHFERVDAMLVSHFGEDNIFGLRTFLERKNAADCFPSVGPVFVNSLEPKSAQGKAANDNLAVNIADESAAIVSHLHKLGSDVRSCIAAATSAVPVNLYYKVGFGSLDMYVLNPTADNKDLKDYLAASAKGEKLSHSVSDSVSVCSIVVFKPADRNAQPTRILFPGAVSQFKLFEGLDRVKANHIFQSMTGLEKPTSAHPASKSASLAGKHPPSASDKSAAKSTSVSVSASKSVTQSAGQHEKPLRPQTNANDHAAKETKKDDAKKVEAKKHVETKTTKPVNGTSEVKKPASSTDHKSTKPSASAREHDKDVTSDAAKRAASAKTAATKSESVTAAKTGKKVDESSKKPALTKKAPAANGKAQPPKSSTVGGNNTSHVERPSDSTTTNVQADIDDSSKPTDGFVEESTVPNLVEIAAEVELEVQPEIVTCMGSGDGNVKVCEPNHQNAALVDESVSHVTEAEAPTNGITAQPNVNEVANEKTCLEPVADVNNSTVESSVSNVEAFTAPVTSGHFEENHPSSDGHENFAADSTTQEDHPGRDTQEDHPSGETDEARSLQDLPANEEQQMLREGPNSFDPVGEWGEPQALPAPTTEKKADESKVHSNRTTAASSEKARPATNKGAEFKAPAPRITVVAKQPSAANQLNATHIAVDVGRRPSTGDGVKRSRLSLQPSEIKIMLSSTAITKSAAAADAAGSKRHVISKPIIPVYVDLAYLPVGGTTVNVDFFKRVRARHYVVSSATADPVILAMLVEAKASWETNSQVTVLPTGDADDMFSWYQAHHDVASSMNITLAPPASQCTVDLHGSLFPAYRLEF